MLLEDRLEILEDHLDHIEVAVVELDLVGQGRLMELEVMEHLVPQLLDLHHNLILDLLEILSLAEELVEVNTHQTIHLDLDHQVVAVMERLMKVVEKVELAHLLQDQGAEVMDNFLVQEELVEMVAVEKF